jgi:heme-degrading monooxygenase HmoA
MHTMPYLLVRHKVEDYERWKPVFDHDHGATRKRSGSKGGWILRNAFDPNELVILLEWDSLENAQRFANADDLREAMQRAGVADQPDVYFLQRVALTLVGVARVHLLCTVSVQEAYRRRSVYRSNDYETRC